MTSSCGATLQESFSEMGEDNPTPAKGQLRVLPRKFSFRSQVARWKSHSNGHGPQNSSYVPTNQQGGNMAFLGVEGILEEVYCTLQSDCKPFLLSCDMEEAWFQMGTWEQEAFEQIKQEGVHAVALEPLRKGQGVKNALYMAAKEMVLPGVSGKKRVKINCWNPGVGDTKDLWPSTPPTEKGTLAAYERMWVASEVICIEAQLLASCQCRAGCSKEKSLAHITPLTLPSGLYWSHTWPEQEIAVARGSWKLSWSGLKARI